MQYLLLHTYETEIRHLSPYILSSIAQFKVKKFESIELKQCRAQFIQIIIHNMSYKLIIKLSTNILYKMKIIYNKSRKISNTPSTAANTFRAVLSRSVLHFAPLILLIPFSSMNLSVISSGQSCLTATLISPASA